ncbi:MAG: hypothetical protein ACREEP_12895 [Dongiaceae bacterium]
MSKIKLDPRKLLGFKIIASDESPAKLQSPKIGDKNCAVLNEDAPFASMAPIAAKVGFKAG